MYDDLMRTTLSIEDDVLAAARSLAGYQKSSVGAVLSELARKGLQLSRQTNRRKGFPIFAIRPEAKPLTLADVQRAEDEP